MLTVTLVHGLLPLLLLVPGRLRETSVHTVVLTATKEVVALHLPFGLAVAVTLDPLRVDNAGVTGAAAVSSLSPIRGVAEGGTPVTVLGSGFSAASEAMGALRCRFNSTDVPAAFVSESAIVCNTTASSAGYASVEVSTNGREYTSSGVRFELVSLVVSDLAPWSGPSLGGTVVTIAGLRLAHVDALECIFGASALGGSGSALGGSGSA